MKTFSDNHKLNEVIASLRDQSDCLKYFKLLWSTIDADPTFNPEMVQDFKKHSPTNDIPIISIMCDEDPSINDYLFKNHNLYYTQNLLTMHTSYN